MTRKLMGPGEVLDFGFDWADQMRKDKDEITDSTWTVASGLDKGLVVLDTVNSITTVVLSGGTVGRTYVCTNKVTTTGGRTWERHLAVEIVGTL